MMTPPKVKRALAAAVVFYAIGLAFFYLRYVPLIKPFEIALVPLLVLCLILTAVNPSRGTLFFIFVFPLINSLPYFFGIFENIPHAPPAIVLFAFYFLGFLLHALFRGARISLNEPIARPLAAFSVAVIASAIITTLRFVNFYPFRGGAFYELQTNVAGVTAGGAVMTAVFFSLNYLTGAGFFLALLNAARSRAFLKKALVLVGISTWLSLVVGLYQHLKNPRFGSSPLTFGLGLINATFKDALSFGAFIAMTLTLILGACLAFKGLLRLWFFSLMFFSLFVVLYSGSKSSLLSIPISLAVFALFSFFIVVQLIRAGSISLKKLNWATWLIIVLIMTAAPAAVASRKYLQKKFAASQSVVRAQQMLHTARSEPELGELKALLGGRVDSLWRMAAAMMRDYPVSGVGIGGYVIEVSNYSQRYAAPLIPQSAENYLLQVGSELGLVGILLVCWIFWEIVKQTRRTWLKLPATDGGKFILSGAMAGVAAFLLQVLTHSFIGSYEIKYTLWLLVGIIYVLGRTGPGEGEPAAPRPLFGPKLKLAGLAGLLLFSGTLLWNSTHSLSLKSRTEQFGIKQDFGFYQAEKTNDGREFRWTREYGGLTVKVEKSVIAIPLLVSHPEIQQRPVKVRIYLVEDFFKSKRLLGELTLSQATWTTYEYEIPGEVGREVILLVEVSRTWNPLKTLGAPDPRNLGAAVGKIEFRDKRAP